MASVSLCHSDVGVPVPDDEAPQLHSDALLDEQDTGAMVAIQDGIARGRRRDALDDQLLVDERPAVAGALHDEAGTGLGGIDGLWRRV